MMMTETKAYGMRLKDHEALMASSSGGAFTALSDVFLNSGNAVVCSSFDFETHRQEFRVITSKKERDAARGSKYFQSVPGDSFRAAEQWLKDHPDGELLFVGMGCQAAGFRSFAAAKGFSDRVTVTDIICHGSSSPQLWYDYAEYIEKQGRIDALSFRDKRNGWERPTAVAVINGSEVPIHTYTKMFYNRKALRLSCHKCPYATLRRAVDITIGDFWNLKNSHPEHYDKDGVSLVLVHTEKGQRLFDEVRDKVLWFESDTADCLQKNLIAPTPAASGRTRFWKDYHEHGMDYMIKKYGTDSTADRVRKKLKRMLSK